MKLAVDISRSLEEADALVERLRSVAQAHLSEEALFGFEIAVSEALTNAIKYAVVPSHSSTFKVVFTRRCNLLLFGIYEPAGGSQFSPAAQTLSLDEIDDLATSGRGIALMHACADDVRFRIRKGRNQLVLAFRTKPNPHEE